MLECVFISMTGWEENENEIVMGSWDIEHGMGLRVIGQLPVCERNYEELKSMANWEGEQNPRVVFWKENLLFVYRSSQVIAFALEMVQKIIMFKKKTAERVIFTVILRKRHGNDRDHFRKMSSPDFNGFL